MFFRRVCHNAKENKHGVEILEKAFESHPYYVTDEDANLLCELYLMEHKYTEVFKVIRLLVEVLFGLS